MGNSSEPKQMEESQDIENPDVVISFKLKAVGDGIATSVKVSPVDDIDISPEEVFITLIETLTGMSEEFGVKTLSSELGFDIDEHATIQ